MGGSNELADVAAEIAKPLDCLEVAGHSSIARIAMQEYHSRPFIGRTGAVHRLEMVSVGVTRSVMCVAAGNLKPVKDHPQPCTTGLRKGDNDPCVGRV
jgi:hypothetical protein